MTPDRPPVTDWATDFDHFHADYATDPVAIWDALRSGCPVAHTDRYYGAYLPVRHDDVAQIARDTEHFSSRTVLVTETPPERAGSFSSPPITSDPPDHETHRRALLPAFSPKAVERLRPVTQDVCRSLIERVLNDGRADGSEDYAKHIPVEITARMIGLPSEDGDQFRTWIHELLEVGPFDPEVAGRATREIFSYFADVVDDHRANPRDDLTSFLIESDLGGRPLDSREVSGSLFLILIAGIDTTWSSIGAALLHLAQEPTDRERLVADPDLIPTAVEEFLRFYSPVTMARVITEEVEVGGTTLCPGERVLLPFPAANRDPDMFDNADRFVVDRQANRHSAFGLGIHRCVGSNLARMEMQVALEEWLTHIPEFELTDANAVTWSAGQVRGPRTIPLRW